MSAEEVVEEVAEKLVEAQSMGSADGLYVSKAGLVRLGVLGAVIAAGAGFVGYKIAQRQMETKYEAILEQQIAEAKAFYSRIHKREDFETPEKAVKSLGGTASVEEAADALLKYQGQDDEGEPIPPEEEEMVVVESTTNVFVQRDNDASNEISAEEINARTPDKPYIISQEEFFSGEPEFEQNSITYYAGDGTLADEKDEEIPYVDPIVGAENLEYFGYGSGDSRIVYIRNERLSLDFEVVKSDGKFSHEVLGFEHADGGARGRQQRNELRKFRGGEE